MEKEAVRVSKESLRLQRIKLAKQAIENVKRQVEFQKDKGVFLSEKPLTKNDFEKAEVNRQFLNNCISPSIAPFIDWMKKNSKEEFSVNFVAGIKEHLQALGDSFFGFGNAPFIKYNGKFLELQQGVSVKAIGEPEDFNSLPQGILHNFGKLSGDELAERVTRSLGHFAH